MFCGVWSGLCVFAIGLLLTLMGLSFGVSFYSLWCGFCCSVVWFLVGLVFYLLITILYGLCSDYFFFGWFVLYWMCGS